MEWHSNYLLIVSLCVAIYHTSARSHGVLRHNACDDVPAGTLMLKDETDTCGKFLACIGKIAAHYKCFSNGVFGNGTVECLTCNEDEELYNDDIMTTTTRKKIVVRKKTVTAKTKKPRNIRLPNAKNSKSGILSPTSSVDSDINANESSISYNENTTTSIKILDITENSSNLNDFENFIEALSIDENSTKVFSEFSSTVLTEFSSTPAADLTNRSSIAMNSTDNEKSIATNGNETATNGSIRDEEVVESSTKAINDLTSSTNSAFNFNITAKSPALLITKEAPIDENLTTASQNNLDNNEEQLNDNKNEDQLKNLMTLIERTTSTVGENNEINTTSKSKISELETTLGGVKVENSSEMEKVLDTADTENQAISSINPNDEDNEERETMKISSIVTKIPFEDKVLNTSINPNTSAVTINITKINANNNEKPLEENLVEKINENSDENAEIEISTSISTASILNAIHSSSEKLSEIENSTKASYLSFQLNSTHPHESSTELINSTESAATPTPKCNSCNQNVTLRARPTVKSGIPVNIISNEDSTDQASDLFRDDISASTSHHSLNTTFTEQNLDFREKATINKNDELTTSGEISQEFEKDKYTVPTGDESSRHTIFYSHNSSTISEELNENSIKIADNNVKNKSEVENETTNAIASTQKTSENSQQPFTESSIALTNLQITTSSPAVDETNLEAEKEEKELPGVCFAFPEQPPHDGDQPKHTYTSPIIHFHNVRHSPGATHSWHLKSSYVTTTERGVEVTQDTSDVHFDESSTKSELRKSSFHENFQPRSLPPDHITPPPTTHHHVTNTKILFPNSVENHKEEEISLHARKLPTDNFTPTNSNQANGDEKSSRDDQIFTTNSQNHSSESTQKALPLFISNRQKVENVEDEKNKIDFSQSDSSSNFPPHLTDKHPSTFHHLKINNESDKKERKFVENVRQDTTAGGRWSGATTLQHGTENQNLNVSGNDIEYLKEENILGDEEITQNSTEAVTSQNQESVINATEHSKHENVTKIQNFTEITQNSSLRNETESTTLLNENSEIKNLGEEINPTKENSATQNVTTEIISSNSTINSNSKATIKSVNSLQNQTFANEIEFSANEVNQNSFNLQTSENSTDAGNGERADTETNENDSLELSGAANDTTIQSVNSLANDIFVTIKAENSSELVTVKKSKIINFDTSTTVTASTKTKKLRKIRKSRRITNSTMEMTSVRTTTAVGGA